MSDYDRIAPEVSSGLSRGRTMLQILHIDPWLLLPILILIAAGLVVLYSAAGQDGDTVMRQVRNLIVGLLAMLIAAQFRVESYRRLAPAFFAVGVLMLIAVPLVGVGAKGAQRWLSLGVVRFQPSELMKVVMPLMVAAWFMRFALPPRKTVLLGALMLVFIPAGLIVIQPDLGTSLLIAASGLFVIFLSGVRWRYIFGAIALAIASIAPAWMFLLKEYQKQRIRTLLDPESDKLGAGWNIIQSKTAIGSGGWTGKGWLQGTQSHLDFLPESHTDFIIAVLSEEFGLRGVLCLLLIYILILWRGFWISLHAQSGFGRLVAGAITLTFFVYVFVNMGMVAGILPIVGVPLPLVSYGGTSIVTLMLSFGILMAISSDHRVIAN